jgi:hypothetical protein
MNAGFLRCGLVVAVIGLCAAFAAPASAAVTYKLDPTLSLRGDCTTSSTDPVADPGCPNPPRPSARFEEPRSIAVDSFGDEYVASFAGSGAQGRIDVFDDEGFFITEMADPIGPKSVAVDSKGNMYVFEGTSEVSLYPPKVYKPEEGKIEYDNADREVVYTDVELPNGGVAVDVSNDHLFVAAGSSILEFSSAEEGNELKATITRSASPQLHSSNWVAVDAERRRLFASSCQDEIKECGILVFNADAPHELLEEIDGSTTPEGRFRSQKGWLSIAVNEETGHFLVDDLENTKNIYEFGENYEYLATLTFSKFQGGNPIQIALSNADGAFNEHYLFVPSLLGPAWAFKLSEVVAPEVEGVEAPNIGEAEAELRATVNPGGGITDYVFQYVSQEDFEIEGFNNAKVAGEGTISSRLTLDRQVTAAAAGLTPGGSYRFRIVVTNEAGTDEAESSFSTYSDAPVGGAACPNSAFRIGPSLLLPDCRAYELVTPPDTNGRPPKGIGYGEDGYPFTTYQASPSGDAVSFMTEGGPLPGTGGTGGFSGDPYRATRTASGWSTVGTGPNGTETNILLPGSSSIDQGYQFWSAGGEGSAVIDGQRTGYIHYPDGHSELIGQGSVGIDPGARGQFISENGTHIIFATRNFSGMLAQQLEPDAPPTGTAAVYDRTSDGVNHVVSLLPGNVTPAPGENAFYEASSRDGAGIAFTIGNTLYLRVDNAVTYQIGTKVVLAGLSEGGRRIFYVEGGDLFAFDTQTQSAIRFSSTGDAVVVNVAEDGSRAYFVSTIAIDDAGSNPHGAVPQPGQQNLYLSEEGRIRFVATVTLSDVEGEVNDLGALVNGLGLWTEKSPDLPPRFSNQPAKDPSRLTPDGTVMVFQSRADLDGSSSNGSRQIYRYDSGGDRLHCISCNPTKVPGLSGGATLQTVGEAQSSAPPFSAFGFVPNLRADGLRAFFESTEPLVAADTDGLQDIYEWEEAGVGSCGKAGGCVYLISSGHSTHENYLYGLSQSGDDVFFTTDDVLVANDNDTLSIYDARVNGGFPLADTTTCQGEGCRPGMSSPPPLSSPAKPALGAKDNVSKKRCPRGKHKVKRHGKVRCIKKKHRGHKHAHRKHAAKKGAAK